jgi:hypothetical protein
MTEEEKNKLFAEFEDAITEYGEACQEVSKAYEWGSAIAWAEKGKKDAYNKLVDIGKKMIDQ